VPLVTLPGFPLNDMLTNILQLSYESGLVNNWIGAKKDIRAVAPVHRLGLTNILPIVFVLCIGCLAGFLVFLLEYTHFRWHAIKTRVSFFEETL